jgi:hypothetical protein
MLDKMNESLSRLELTIDEIYKHDDKKETNKLISIIVMELYVYITFIERQVTLKENNNDLRNVITNRKSKTGVKSVL